MAARISSVLAVANVTADSDVLLDALRERARSGPLAVTVVVPAGGAERPEARKQLDRALARMRKAGLEADGQLGPPDPCVAAVEVWDPARFDEILVCTLPVGPSRWLQIDLPHRLERLTGARVTHLEVPQEETPPAPPPVHVEPHEHHGLLEPLEVLSWGGKPRRT